MFCLIKSNIEISFVDFIIFKQIIEPLFFLLESDIGECCNAYIVEIDVIYYELHICKKNNSICNSYYIKYISSNSIYTNDCNIEDQKYK